MKSFFLIYIFLFSFFSIAQDDNKVKRTFYNDSILAIERWYGNDKKLDSLKTFYKTGELNELFYYDKSYYHGKSYKFNRIGEKLTTWEFNKGKLINRTDHKIEFSKKTEKKVKNAHATLVKLNEQLKQKPNDFKSRYQRASIRQYLGNYTLALNDFKKVEKRVLKLNKTKKIPEKLLGSIFDNLASIYQTYEMENTTIHYRLKAITASPKESRLYYNLGNYLIQIKSYRLGIQFHKKAIEMVPEHSFANWSLASAYTDLGDYEKAMACVNIAFKNVDNLYKRGRGFSERDLWTLRGFLYHKLGQSDKGIADLEEALNINANNSYALRNLGVIYHDLGNYTKSCELLKKAKKLGYDKTHDLYDLDDYIEHSCNRKLTEHELIKLSDRPYVYPNPASDIIGIYHFNFKDFNYRIYNFESKLIHAGKAENKSINISFLPSGLYILEVETNDSINTFKIVKE